jgi:hypothetical protein
MWYFDFEKAAREANIPAGKLEELCAVVRRDSPADDMMFELHMLRACKAIRDGVVSLSEAVRPEPAPTVGTR